MRGTLLAIQIDGMKMTAALNENGERRDRRQMTMRFDAAGFQEILASLTESWPQPDKVAVATTGSVRKGRLQSLNPDSIPFWRSFPLAEEIARRFPAPLVLINNAQASAWAEFVARDAQIESLLFLNLANEVSGGLVLDGVLRVGEQGLAGHIGALTLSRAPMGDGEACGSLEQIVSGMALGRQASRVLKRLADGPSLFALAQTDDRADAILDNAAAAVAEAIGNCRLMVDIDAVVLGGNIGLAAGMIQRIEKAQETLPEHCRVPLLAAKLGADAPLIGVTDWATRQG